VPTAPAGWSAELRRARWLDGTRFEIGGWAYLRTNPGLSALDATIRVYLQDAAGSRRLATASRLVSAEVNALSTDAAHDWSTAAFEAVIDVAPLLERLHRGTVTQNWTVWIELGDGAHEIAGRFLRRHAWGSAGELSAEAFGDDRHVRPVWTDEAGLGFDVARRNVVADELILTGRTLSGTLHRNGAFDATGVMLEDAKTKKQTTAALTGDAASSTFSISVPRSNALSSRSTLSYLYVIDAAGVRRHVHWAATRGLESSERPTDGLLVRHGASGVIRIEEHMAGVLVDDVEFVGGDDPVVRISGGWRGATSGVHAELRGPRQTVPARSTTVADGRFTAIIPLLVEDAWGNTGVAPYNGSYRVWAVLDDDTQAQARVSQLFVETLPHKVFDALVNLRVERTPQNCFSLDIRGPLPEEETGPFNFGRMARRYTAQVTEPRPVDLADAVYYESFGGRTANAQHPCHPRRTAAPAPGSHALLGGRQPLGADSRGRDPDHVPRCEVARCPCHQPIRRHQLLAARRVRTPARPGRPAGMARHSAQAARQRPADARAAARLPQQDPARRLPVVVPDLAERAQHADLQAGLRIHRRGSRGRLSA